MVLDVGLVGLGTIARAQHLPAIAATEGLRLAAIASRNARLDHVPSYPDISAMLAAGSVGAVSLCTPPQGRFGQAMAVLRAGCHLMLEKPPGATLSEVEVLRAEADRRGLTLFATWHSREAEAIAPARDWLAGRRVLSARVDWCEDVRKWHPGQDWIWRAGGLGVFDPGINGLSILTALVPGVVLTAADLHFPGGRQTPIAADLRLRAGDAPITARLDWRGDEGDLWRIEIVTDGGTLVLDQGGAVARVDGVPLAGGENREYARLYARFRDLVAGGRSDVDLAPMRLVADAFVNGVAHRTEPFQP